VSPCNAGIGRFLYGNIVKNRIENCPKSAMACYNGPVIGPTQAGLPGRLFASRPRMNDVTRLLSAAEQGDPRAAEQLLPLVYDELRKLAAAKLAHEKPGGTLQAIALVHEAYLRLVKADEQRQWNSRGHFFAAAAEAMRRILVEQARRRGAAKRGGQAGREELHASAIAAPEPVGDVLALNDALDAFAAVDPVAARLVSLRYFAGLTTSEAAQALDMSVRSAQDLWAYARSWLHRRMRSQ
jgi:RNA polymerase sigma factor (TIGR02999 family)